MKKMKLYLVALLAIVLTSCVTTSYFQVYKAAFTKKTNLKDSLLVNELVYEDANCKVSYDLWDDGGNIGFKFYNRTDKNIYLNLEESFFIFNGMAYNYYQNRVFTNSKSTGISASSTSASSKHAKGMNNLDLIPNYKVSKNGTSSVGVTTTSGNSVSYNEEKIVCIPSMTSKIIKEYSITHSLYRDCDLFKYPRKRQIKTKTFKKSDSPLVFSNRLTYAVGQTVNPVTTENEFYVTEITNYPEKKIVETKVDEFCGQKGSLEKRVFKNVSTDKFYFHYFKTDKWKH